MTEYTNPQADTTHSRRKPLPEDGPTHQVQFKITHEEHALFQRVHKALDTNPIRQLKVGEAWARVLKEWAAEYLEKCE